MSGPGFAPPVFSTPLRLDPSVARKAREPRPPRRCRSKCLEKLVALEVGDYSKCPVDFPKKTRASFSISMGKQDILFWLLEFKRKFPSPPKKQGEKRAAGATGQPGRPKIIGQPERTGLFRWNTSWTEESGAPRNWAGKIGPQQRNKYFLPGCWKTKGTPKSKEAKREANSGEAKWSRKVTEVLPAQGGSWSSPGVLGERWGHRLVHLLWKARQSARSQLFLFLHIIIIIVDVVKKQRKTEEKKHCTQNQKKQQTTNTHCISI